MKSDDFSVSQRLLGLASVGVAVSLLGIGACSSDESSANTGSADDASAGDVTTDGSTRSTDAGDDHEAAPPASVAHAPAQIASGTFHTCAILENKSVKCWGYNSEGQLGLGDTQRRGDNPKYMGAALPAVDLGTGRSALSIAAGTEHTCALLDDHSVKCWGSNDLGQLGIGDHKNRGDGPGEMGDALPAIDFGGGRTVLALGSTRGSTTCALLSDHSVVCWGSGSDLGLDPPTLAGSYPLPSIALGKGHTGVAVTYGSAHGCAVLDDHSVKCWGTNFVGECGFLNGGMLVGDEAGEMNALLPVNLGAGRTAQSIFAANSFTCTILDDHSLKCWGYNTDGQIGIGSSLKEVTQMGDALPAVALGTGRTAKAIALSIVNSCAVLDDGSIKCWGANSSGQLGLGDTNPRGTQSNEMGDALPAVSLGAGRTAVAVAPGGEMGDALPAVQLE